MRVLSQSWTQVMSIHTSSFTCKVVPKNLKGRTKSSQDWLARQLKDPYVKLAKYEHYRARSAYKLVEIDDRCRIFRPGQVVVECGAAPGAWTQVAVNRVNSLPRDPNKSKGMVLGVDLIPIHPLPGATFLGGKDFTSPNTQLRLLELLQGRKVDVVLSDMAPNATGNKQMDHENIVELVYSALRFAVQHSTIGGSFLCKIWGGFKDKKLTEDLEKFYKNVRVVKPPSSRSDSAEKFLLCRNFNVSENPQ